MYMLKEKIVINESTLKQQKKYFPVIAFSVFMLAVVAANPFVFAAVQLGGNAQSVLENIISLIGLVFKIIGGILTIWGAGQLILAFKNEDADSKSRAIMCLVCGLALFAFPTVMKSLGITASNMLSAS